MTKLSEQAGVDILKVEFIREEIEALQSDISEIYQTAKARGDDTKAMKEAIRRRSKGLHEHEEFDEKVQVYLASVEVALRSHAASEALRARVRPANKAGPSHTVPLHDPDTGEILDEPAPTPEPAARPLSVAAETIAAPVNETAPRPLTPTGGDVSDSAAGADDIDASSQTVGGAPAVTAAASETIEDRATHFDFDIPDHLTEHQRAGYIARMQGKNGIAPEGYPNRREWSQGFIAALDHMPTKAADADDDEPEAPMPPPPDFNAEVPEFLRG